MPPPTSAQAFSIPDHIPTATIPSKKITGDARAVKKALLVVSTNMYKFSPKEEISLETAVGELPPPSIIIPSIVPIYPSSNLYHSSNALVAPPRSITSVIGGTQSVSELHGYADTGSTWPLYSSTIPVLSSYGAPSRSEELVVRVLCPSDKIGHFIGKEGIAIRTLRQYSGARIDVNDTKKNSEDCIITITSTESNDDVISAVIEAVLLLQGKINDEGEEIVTIHLLVPTKVMGCLTGKGGSIINDMHKKTRADIRISKGEKPKSVSPDDEQVEDFGKPYILDLLKQSSMMKTIERYQKGNYNTT